ncbi:MAG: pre-peptidase [Planctomycetales bacterium]
MAAWAMGLAVWGLCVSSVWGAAPTLTHLFPAGGERGTKVTVTCSGTFNWPPSVWSPGVDVTPTAESGKLEVSIPADLAADRIWIRLYNAEGASALAPFLIGSLPELAEVEPNNSPKTAQKIDSPRVTINGALGDGDVDGFAVALEAGQTLVAAVDAHTRLGSPMDAILQVATSNGTVLAENHDDLKLDPRLAFTPRTAGTYIVRLFAFSAAPNSTIAFQGGANFIYRLTLTTGPYVTHAAAQAAPRADPGTVGAAGWNLPADLKLPVVSWGGARLAEFQEFEVLDELRRSPDARLGLVFDPALAGAARVRLGPYATAPPLSAADPQQPATLTLPTALTGCLKQPRQTDTYRLPLTKGQPVIISVESRSLDLPIDPVVQLTDPNGAVVADLDDTGPHRDALIAHTAAHDGDYRLTITDRYRHGTERYVYLLTVRLEEADFELSATADAIVVNPDKPTELTIKVQRRGTAASAMGPITIQAVGLPKGVTAPPVVSEPTGPTAAEVKLQLSSTGAAYSGPVQVQGQASQPRALERFARTPARLGVAFETIWLTSIGKP